MTPLFVSATDESYSMIMQLTTEEFVKRAKAMHGGEYDYSKAQYSSMSVKVCIICPEHGEFWQKPSNHLRGQKCPKCANKNRGKHSRKDQEYYLNRAIAVHGNKYDYSQSEFNTTRDAITIICPIHGSFEQNLGQHLTGRGCPKCANEANKSLVHGIGINDLQTGEYPSKCYEIWAGMLYRCYKSDWRVYSDVQVCDEWHTFSNFKAWFENPENGYREGYHLDKDILVKKNRIYSPETCCFVPSAINGLLVGCNNKQRNKTIGVRLESPGSYLAQITKHHKAYRIGLFPTEEEAFSAYKREKEAYICEIAKKFYKEGAITEKVYAALLNYEVEICD